MTMQLDEAATAVGSVRPVSKSRFVDVDRAKAVAILLVVTGHILDPQSPPWWRTLRFDIYNFHMPLFMYLSGYVYYKAANNPKNSDFTRFSIERANRLLVPFFVFGFAVINIKFFARSFAELRRSDFSYFSGYKYLFLNTSQNPAFDLWYLFVLFIFSIVSYHAMRGTGQWRGYLFTISIAAYAVFAYYEPRGGMTDDLYLDHLCWFYIFFVIGAIACSFRGRLYNIQRLIWPFAMVLFFLAEFAMNRGEFAFFSGWRFLIIGVLSIIFIHGLLMTRPPVLEGLLRLLSENTMVIYLFNSMIIAALQQTVFRAHSVQSLPYAIQAFTLVVVATVLPIVLRFAIFRIDVLKKVRFYLA